MEKLKNFCNYLLKKTPKNNKHDIHDIENQIEENDIHDIENKIEENDKNLVFDNTDFNSNSNFDNNELHFDDPVAVIVAEVLDEDLSPVVTSNDQLLQL